MPSQGRPKTEAATYRKFTARLPEDVLDILSDRSEDTGTPINTLLIKAVRRGLRLPVDGVREDTAAPMRHAR